MLKETKPLSLKTGVSTRVSISDRLNSAQSEAPAANKWSMKRGVDQTVYSESTKAFVSSAADIPIRMKEPRLGAQGSEGSKLFAVTTCQSNTDSYVQGGRDPSFFSRARRAEQVDDSMRHTLDTIPTRSGASHNQRTVDIMRKREECAELKPPKETFMIPPRRPLNGEPPKTALESVRFTYTVPDSSQQLDFKQPSSIIPSHLGQKMNIQRRALSETASARDMFPGTAKSRADILPGYLAHVPADESNIAKLHGETDVLRAYTKAGASVSGSSSLAKLARISGRSASDKIKTSQGFYLEQAASAGNEKSLNKVAFGKKTAVLN
jgi:hypothetical protein